MGFVVREGEGSGKVYNNEEYHCKVTIHTHNEGARVPADFLREVKIALQKAGFFNNPDNREKFPFEKWGFKRNTVDYDNSAEIEQQEIENANKEYEDAVVYPIFPTKDSVCALESSDGVNLCRSSNDRRPLLNRWFEECDLDNKTGKKYCLKYDNWDDGYTEAYPIKPDGTLDKEDY